MARAPRLAFGDVAELYDRARPGYPDALVDDVVELSGAEGRALEVGAGTGKATVMFAARGLTIQALEPSPAMAAIARRRCSSYDGVTIEEREFERWQPSGDRFSLVFSAQAWHWIRPEVRYARARAALRDGGLLAAFWTRPQWERCAMRDELRAAYAQTVPDFGPDPGPMHPGSEIAPDRWEDWDAEIAGAEGLVRPEVRFYEWTGDYTAQRYSQLIGTSQDHILLADDTRDALLSAVRGVVEQNGGTLTMPFVTKLCLARKENGR